MILPIFRRPDFTKLQHKTSIGEALKTFGKKKFPVKGSFFQKLQKM